VLSHTLWLVLSNKVIWVLGHCWVDTQHTPTFEGDSVLSSCLLSTVTVRPSDSTASLQRVPWVLSQWQKWIQVKQVWREMVSFERCIFYKSCRFCNKSFEYFYTLSCHCGFDLNCFNYWKQQFRTLDWGSMYSNPCESKLTCLRPESNREPYELQNFLSAALSTTELWWRMNHRRSFRTLWESWKLGHARSLGHFTREIIRNDENLSQFLPDCKVLWMTLRQPFEIFIKLWRFDCSRARFIWLRWQNQLLVPSGSRKAQKFSKNSQESFPRSHRIGQKRRQTWH